MKRWILPLAIVGAMASPATATGGLVCRTAGPRPVEIAVGFGHVAGTPLLPGARMSDKGRDIPVSTPQWWFDGTEMRFLLTDPNGLRREAIVKAKRNGRAFDGNLWRGGRRYWVRCRES